MDHFISMYIDDEMSLEEKILFINTIHGDETYRNDTVSMLEQEKKLVTTLIRPLPERALPFSKNHRSFHSMGLALAVGVLLVVSFLAGVNLNSLNGSLHQDTVMIPGTVPHRFVLHHLGPAQVEITGSFTEWQKVPLIPTGSEGYWEITLDVPAGEHRYSFVIDGTRLVPDPTVATKEPDDFGSVNSILLVES